MALTREIDPTAVNCQAVRFKPPPNAFATYLIWQD
jgi:hypothetical protein